MYRPPVVAALVVAMALTGLVVFAFRGEAEQPVSAAPPQPLTTTTTEPDFAALVRSGVVSTLPAAESELTEEALARTTSTTTTTVVTTTTTAPTTTTTEAAATNPPTTSPPTTSPPTTSPPTTVAVGYVSSAENDFASRINSYRSSNGLGGLSRDGSLDSYARSWAQTMGERGDLGHSDIGSLLPPWNAAGENVGVGSNVTVIFDALVGSSGHRANMLGDWTHMGIGVWQDASGELWTCHVFAR